MNHSDIIFCNGLVEKPGRWAGHLEALDELLMSAVGRADAQVQINVDWRPLGMSAREAVRSARAHYGERLKSIVSYWDPAHSAAEIVELFDGLDGVARSTLVRLNMRSAESVRVLKSLLARGALSNATVLLNVDSLSRELINQLLLVTDDQVRFQVSNETPRRHVEELTPALVGAVQIAIGSAENIDEKGYIRLDDGMVVRGEYRLSTYLAEYANIPGVKLVVMGPALPEWGTRENYMRLSKAYALLRKTTDRGALRTAQENPMEMFA